MAFHVALPSADVPDGSIVAITVFGHDILICRSGSSVFAADDSCPHAGARLSAGTLKSGQIMCPLHGGRFDLKTGQCLSKVLNSAPMQFHDVRERNGMIEVSLPLQQRQPGEQSTDSTIEPEDT